MKKPETKEAALARSSERSGQRREMRSKFMDGTLSPYLVIEGSLPEWREVTETMKVLALLRAIPGIGNRSRNYIFKELDIPVEAQVRDLSPSQRKRLAQIAREMCG